MKKLAVIAILSVYFTVGAAGLAHEEHNDAFSEEHSAGARPVEVDEQGVQAIGIKTVSADLGNIENVMKATGEVKAAENNEFDVNAPTSGSVRGVFAKHGDCVQSGQVLATIHSMEVADHLTELITERNKIQAEIERTKLQYVSDIALQQKEVELAQAEFTRQNALLAEKITAVKTFQQAKNDLEKAKVKLATLCTRKQQEEQLSKKQLAATIANMKGQLTIMGIAPAAVDRALAGTDVTADVPIRAPCSGVVTFRDVTLGERVDPGKKLFSVVNINPIWVMVDVFQEQIPKIQLGQQVKLTTPSKQVVKGTISSIDSVVDPVKKTLHVRIVAQNQSAILRPGMFVNAEIVLEIVVSKHVVLPAAAVVENAGKHIVYKRSGSKFTPLDVILGEQAGGRVEILEGVSRGDIVVVSGARQLLAQGMIGGEAEEQEHEGPGHDEHGAHDKHEAAMEHQTRPEVMMVMTFVAGLATAVLAYLAIAIARSRRAFVNPSIKEKEREKVDA